MRLRDKLLREKQCELAKRLVQLSQRERSRVARVADMLRKASGTDEQEIAETIAEMIWPVPSDYVGEVWAGKKAKE